MLKRLVCASVLSLAVLGYSSSAAFAAGAPAVQVATPQVTTPAAPSAPSAACAPGITYTACQVVLGLLCRHVCGSDASSPAQSTAAATRTAAATQQRSSTAAAATSTAASPTIYCAKGFEILCTVLGLTLCRNHPCGIDAAATSTAASPTIYCAKGFEILCTVLALTLCRNHPCGIAAASQTTAAEAAITLPPGDICTVNDRVITFICTHT